MSRSRFTLSIAGGALAVALAGACTSAAPATPVPAVTPAVTAATSAAASAANGFGSPDDAVRAYVTGVAAADADAILATTAVDRAAASFDFAGQAERLKVLQLTGPAPAQYPFYVDINRAYFADRILSQVKMLSYSLLSTETVDVVPVPADGPQASAFAAEVDPSRLSGLLVVDVKFPDASLENDSRYLANAEADAHIYGATASTQRLALVSLNNTDYAVGFTLLQYADGWRVIAQSAALSTLPATGAAQQMTQQQFDQLTGGS